MVFIVCVCVCVSYLCELSLRHLALCKGFQSFGILSLVRSSPEWSGLLTVLNECLQSNERASLGTHARVYMAWPRAFTLEDGHAHMARFQRGNRTHLLTC